VRRDAGGRRPAAGRSIQAIGARPAVPGVTNPGGLLFGVFCTSAANCWADGESAHGTVQLNQMLHWNGKTWRHVSLPNPAGMSGSAINELFAVRCLNAQDCWAAGDYSKNDTTFLAEALHWNGRRWSRVATPQAGCTKLGDISSLADAICTSAQNCWAVGEYGTEVGRSATKVLNLVLHWNGKRWSRVRVPNPAGTGTGDLNLLGAVRCLSATNCTAVGDSGTVETTTTSSSCST
jgi:hypothetical protein